MMSAFVFITDLHLDSTYSFRTGDPVDECIAKVDYCVEYANSVGADIILGGDTFNRSAVPYAVTNSLIYSLRKAKGRVFCIWGNHDKLFRQDLNDPKCALETLISSGIVIPVDDKTYDLGDCYLTNVLPLSDKDKPQILVYHGFLNIDDGKYTVPLDALLGVSTPALALLGHDHSVHAPTAVGSVHVLRPGSLFRCDRDESQYRQPQLVDIRVSSEGGISYSFHEVPCRSSTEIFHEKAAKVVSVKEVIDYSDLVSQLKSAGTSEEDFLSVVSRIAEEDVYSYIQQTLSSARVVSAK